MDLTQAAASFAFLPLRLRIVPQQVLRLPAIGKSNTLRGAFGMAFRRLVCIPQCREARLCPLGQACPYRIIFEPSPPPGADRLSKNQDIPRPFIFRPPLDVTPNVAPTVAPNVAPGLSPESSALKGGSTKTTYSPGEAFDFTLILLGKAVDFLPYFILAFREVASEGIGLNRAKCTLEKVEQIDVSEFEARGSGFGIRDSGSGDAIRNPESGIPCPEPRVPIPAAALIYTAADQLFRTPTAKTLGDYVQSRLAQLSTFDSRLSTVNYQLSTAFLTPTYLKSEGQAVRQPEFHHLFKRVRDRLNALSTFYGPGPIDADFKGLGQAAEKVRTVKCDVHRREHFRRSRKTGQRRKPPGVTGKSIYEFPKNNAEISIF
jgi:hypothetical protein